MAICHPFRALRPSRSRVSEVACPPYDTVDWAEARSIAQSSPNSFMAVVRGDALLPEGTAQGSAEACQTSHSALAGLLARGILEQEPQPTMYAYRQVMSGHRQSGLVCCVDVEEYRRGVIAQHERTRPEKEGERLAHMLALSAHAEPVFLAARCDELAEQLRREMNDRPLFHFVAKDGVTHSLWSVQDPAVYQALLAPMERLYIADGHHRCAAALRAHDSLRASNAPAAVLAEAARFPAVIFPATDLHIAPYHRIVLSSDVSADALLARLSSESPLQTWESGSPGAPGWCCLRTPGAWHRFRLERRSSRRDRTDTLDVDSLQRRILGPMLGITDPRHDQRLSFIGGNHTDLLAHLVDSGKAALAFAMFPMAIDQVLAIADAGEIAPPKSTWFEPKLRSGLFVHSFAPEHLGAAAK